MLSCCILWEVYFLAGLLLDFDAFTGHFFKLSCARAAVELFYDSLANCIFLQLHFLAAIHGLALSPMCLYLFTIHSVPWRSTGLGLKQCEEISIEGNLCVWDDIWLNFFYYIAE